MKKKPNPAAKVGVVRHRPANEINELHDKHEDHPIMVELYRRAEGKLRRQQKHQKAEAVIPKLAHDPPRLLHELQVHQVELELQNIELLGARNELEAALESYTDLYDFAPVGYFSIDEAGLILKANLTGATLLGIERSRLIDRRILIYVFPASRPVFLTFLKEVFSRRKDETCEVRLLKQDGTTFWASLRATSAVSLKGSRKWCRVAFKDITARKTVETALQESEKRYRTLFELFPAAVYSCDSTGAIQNFNQRAAELWGRTPMLGDTDEQFCGSFKLFRPDGSLMPHKKSPMAEVVTGKLTAVNDAEVIIERPDGSRITVVVNIRPLKDEHGKVVGAINCFYDITGRKEAETARRRLEVLAASNQKFEREIARRTAVEKALRKSEQHQSRLLKQSRHMQAQLRRLSHQILNAQEEERKRISRELHDEIAQTLVGINVHLAALTMAAGDNPVDLQQKIVRTRRLVEKTVDIVHQFARELRPATLDDLGLIPALHAFIKEFTKRTGVRAQLKAYEVIEQLDIDKRTVLYRVAQEALTNVARHAQASEVRVSIERLSDRVCLKIKDNGKSFVVARALPANGGKRLGLLGMRERLEMVGGSFSILSAPHRGTTVIAEIPLDKHTRGGAP